MALDYEKPLPANIRILSELSADHAAFSIVDEAALRSLSEAEVHHFWFRTRNHFLSKRLVDLGCTPPARILELGCGGGVVCAHLSRLGFQVTGVDGHLARVREAAQRTPDGLFFVHDLTKGTTPFHEGAFDAVGFFDVIEHLDRPREALISALDCARPQGLVVGTVPALMSLWSEVDAQAGHRLRYERASLGDLLHSIPGASLVEIRAFNHSLVPMLFLQRRLFGRRGSSIPVPNLLLDRALGALLWLEQELAMALDEFRLPGASLWFALRKDATQSTPARRTT